VPFRVRRDLLRPEDPALRRASGASAKTYANCQKRVGFWLAATFAFFIMSAIYATGVIVGVWVTHTDQITPAYSGR